MKKLISAVEFWLHLITLCLEPKRLIQVYTNHVNFLKKPLELGMFVPCDLEGNVLENPLENRMRWINFTDKERSEYCDKWEEAKERVFFKGLDVDYKSKISICFSNSKRSVRYSFLSCCFECNEIKIIEDLIPYELELTENAIKQIGYKQ